MPDDHVFVFSQTPLVAEMRLSTVGAVEATFRMVRTLRDTVGSWSRGPAVFDPSHRVHYSMRLMLHEIKCRPKIAAFAHRTWTTGPPPELCCHFDTANQCPRVSVKTLLSSAEGSQSFR